jgi:hypothetical protein
VAIELTLVASPLHSSVRPCGFLETCRDEPTGRQATPASVKLRARSLAPLVKARDFAMTPHRAEHLYQSTPLNPTMYYPVGDNLYQ